MTVHTQDCCRTTEDGAVYCALPPDGQQASCSCQSNTIPRESQWDKVRGGVMFVVACITSPCCTPLIVPVILALLAGTPIAGWITYHQGWVYGGLTLVSIISLVLALRWLNKPKPSKVSPIRLSDIPVLKGEQAHAE